MAYLITTVRNTIHNLKTCIKETTIPLSVQCVFILKFIKFNEHSIKK